MKGFSLLLLVALTIQTQAHVLYDDLTTQRPTTLTYCAGLNCGPDITAELKHIPEHLPIPLGKNSTIFQRSLVLKKIKMTILDMEYRPRIVAQVEFTPPMKRGVLINIIKMLEKVRPRADMVSFRPMRLAPEVSYRISFKHQRSYPFFAPIG